MITVFSSNITERLRYIFEFYFEELLKVTLQLTDDASSFEKTEGVKLNYSDLNFKSCKLDLRPHTLLFQKGVEYQDMTPVPCEEQLCFFATSPDSFLPFDPFAAGFYLISRYEEYLGRELDEHNRFSSQNSVLHRNNMLNKPVVNQWAQIVAQKIKSKFPAFIYKKPEFNFLTTIDVDNAWAYKNKSLKRIVGASLKNLMYGEIQKISCRLRVLANKEEDPYDSYNYVKNTYSGIEEHLQFFFLLGNPGKYDRNISPRNQNLRLLIKELSGKFKVGIHPSYGSDKKDELLLKEINLLNEITGIKSEDSRQHYLKLVLPVTYDRLIKAGIKNDFTLGFADNIGFRAGTASPFFFYDLSNEEKTTLRIFPFQTMDVAMKDYLNLNPQEAWEEIRKIMLEIKQYGGTFISLWHNESIGGKGIWNGWKQVFEDMTELAIKLKNESEQNYIH